MIPFHAFLGFSSARILRLLCHLIVLYAYLVLLPCFHIFEDVSIILLPFLHNRQIFFGSSLIHECLSTVVKYLGILGVFMWLLVCVFLLMFLFVYLLMFLIFFQFQIFSLHFTLFHSSILSVFCSC